MAARTQQGSGLGQETARFRDMLEHRPECDRIELRIAEIMLEKGSAQHGDTPFFGAIQRARRNVRAQYAIRAGPSLLQPMEKPARGTANVENVPAATVTAQDAEFSPESHRRVIALQLCR